MLLTFQLSSKRSLRELPLVVRRGCLGRGAVLVVVGALRA